MCDLSLTVLDQNKHVACFDRSRLQEGMRTVHFWTLSQLLFHSFPTIWRFSFLRSPLCICPSSPCFSIEYAHYQHVSPGQSSQCRWRTIASYRWTSWVCELISWGLSQLTVHDNYRSISRNLWYLPPINKKQHEISQHVIGWTWKHEDFDRLCPKLSLNSHWIVLHLWQNDANLSIIVVDPQTFPVVIGLRFQFRKSIAAQDTYAWSGNVDHVNMQGLEACISNCGNISEGL